MTYKGIGEYRAITLTTGIDNIVGTPGNDIINATETTARVLGPLDTINGEAGTDTMNVADSLTTAGTAFTFGGASIKNVEIINVATNGNFAGLDISKIEGIQSFKGTSADAAASSVTAADTTDVNLTLATTNNSTVAGGKAVTVIKGAAATGTLGVSGKGLSDVTIKGGAGVVTINNQENSVAATANKGTTLKSVTLDGVDANTGIGGEGLESVAIKGATTAARTVTITNAKVDHALTLNVDSTGYKTDGTEVQTVVTDTAAKSITVNATGSKSSLDVSGSTTAATINIVGSAALKLDADVANVKTIDGSAATGNLNLGTVNAATTTVKTGAGNDQFTLGAAKVTVDSGAGNDTVTLNGAIAAGSTINLGAGNDKLLATGTGSVAASTASATTVIDAGDGVDSIAANLINVGNAAQFKNFELLNLDSTTGLDLALLAANNTLTGLTMSSASTSATYQNVSKELGLTVDFIGNNSAVVNTLQLKDVTGTADAYTITFSADNSAAATAPVAANVQAGTVVTAGIENYSIVSGGEKAWNEINLGVNNAAQSVVITGGANLDLTFGDGVGVGTFGSTTTPNTGVSLIDGSAATGKLSINTTDVTSATAGLTVKGGSANDTITLAQKATVDAGAGNDTVTLAAAGGTVTTGVGNDTVDVKAAVAGSTTAPVISTITDFTVAADKLTLKDQGTETFTSTKVDVSTATALFGGTVNALDLASAADGSTNAAVTWFQYAGDTYVVQDLSAVGTFAITDIVVKLSGLVDLSTLTVTDFNFA